MRGKRLAFVKTLKGGMAESFEFWKSLFVEGRCLLNRSEWRGKEPRSCGVTKVSTRPHDEGQSVIMEIDISYYPSGFIRFEANGQTRFDGWTLTVLDKTSDGTLLDGHGQPLEDGATPVYLPYEINHDTDFNDIDFGEFVGEFEARGVSHIAFDDVISGMKEGAFVVGGNSAFVVPHRIRPLTQIVLSGKPTGVEQDGFGTHHINICNDTPNLQEAVADALTQLMCDFLEGKINVETIGNSDSIVVRLSNCLVDCGPNEDGLDSFFDILHLQTTDVFVEELALRLQSRYEIEVTVVDDGDKACGLLIKRTSVKT